MLLLVLSLRELRRGMAKLLLVPLSADDALMLQFEVWCLLLCLAYN